METLFVMVLVITHSLLINHRLNKLADWLEKHIINIKPVDYLYSERYSKTGSPFIGE